MELWRWESHFWDLAFQVLKALDRTATKPGLGFKVRHEGLKVRSHFWDLTFQVLKVENKTATKPCWVFKVSYGGLKVRSRFWDPTFQVLRLPGPGQTDSSTGNEQWMEESFRHCLIFVHIDRQTLHLLLYIRLLSNLVH
jgi:hypothetical protein